jgi:hypothetical protein
MASSMTRDDDELIHFQECLSMIISNADPQLPDRPTINGLLERVLDALYGLIPEYQRKFEK